MLHRPHLSPGRCASRSLEIDEERLLVCRVTQLLGVLESASIER